MPIAATCPYCRRAGTLPDRAAGKDVNCPACGNSFAVPPAHLLAAAGMLKAPAAAAAAVVAGRDCPFCGEVVRDTARVCKHCGETLDPALRAAEEAKRRADAPRGDVSQQVVVHVPRAPFPHLMHFVLTLLTCGAWAPIWLLHWLLR